MKTQLSLLLLSLSLIAAPPNIVWIVIEDASPHIGCYGETAIKTPVMDQMAGDGIRFANAFVTAPVCSPSRSAMVSGMYQMTLGAHNHRSQARSGKGGGNSHYYDSYRVPESMPLIPQLFAAAGYHVTNKSKTDYNFVPTGSLYHGNNWKKAKPDQPIFAQFQLGGGKNRRVPKQAEPSTVEIPPYYPEHPVIREDWAKYLDSWVAVDKEVGKILTDLETAGRLDSTAVFLWTDHGVSHLRGKQFLYEEGIRVPMILRLPSKAQAGSVRPDIVEHIDVAAASLALAGIAIPDYVQGRDFLAADYRPRDHLFCGRDRCDETVDTIRAIRDPRFKYIRNFMSHVSHAQPSQYKDGKKILQTIRALHAEGKLNDVQARPFAPRRPPEELYDLQNDPHELINLAAEPQQTERLAAMRSLLQKRMLDVRDMGLIPEPILEDLGRAAGSKYAAFQDPTHRAQTKRLIALITAGEAKDEAALREFAESADPATRYWAAVWLGVNATGKMALERLVDDTVPAVRVAAAQALVKLGDTARMQDLVAHINDPNLLVGLYALRAIEELGNAARAHRAAIAAAQKSPYEFSRRIARRLTNKWK
jgi:arylsulfatase A-like enzyme